MTKTFLLIAFLIPAVLFAQSQKAGALTIFSEDGDKFFLVLNGEKQNAVAQTNLRVEELPQPYYSAKIVFTDSTIAPLTKKALYIADADGIMKDVTYKIRKDKAGKVKLNYYSMTDVVPDFIPPSNVRVYHYGRSTDEGITRTTTTTTTAPAGASVNVNGVSMNVTINDPVFSESTTTTTTTQSNSSIRNHENHDRCENGYYMRPGDFTAAKKTIADASFEDSKLSTAKSVASSNCLTSAQVTEICNLFSFEDTKLAFAKYAYKYTTDPRNYFKVNNVFSFDASKDELNKFVSGE
jgi:hypothetical protein